MTPRTKWYLFTSTLLLAGAVIDLSGLSPWPLVFVLFATTAIAFAQKVGYVFGVAASSATLLSALAWWFQVAPHLHGDLRFETFFVEISLILAILVVLGSRKSLIFPGSKSISYYWPAGILSAVIAITLWALGVAGKLGYSWAMHNDAVWNIVVSRFVTGDGGIVSSLHSNPSPLVPELLSFASLSGRDLNSTHTLFQHDMTRAAETWILIALLSSLIAGLIALSICKVQQSWLRIMSAVTVGSLPLAWFSLGYALEFGFYNATLALLIMLLSWLIWQSGSKDPYARLGALGLTLLACLAAWGPLALIPASLAILGIVLIFAQRIKPSVYWSLGFVGFSWTSVIVYGIFVTLPDLRQQSGALGADGGIFEISPIQAVITVGASFFVIAVSAWRLRKSELLLGIIFFTLSSLLAIAYLVLQRGENVSRWGYYPVKYSWLLMCALLVIATAFALAWIASTSLRSCNKVVAILLAGVFVFALAWQMPIRNAPTYLSIFPFANIVTHTGVAGEDAYADRLFSITVSGQPTIVYRGADLLSDQFAEKWLLQLESKTSEDKIRYWAYFMDPTNHDHLCRALLDWGTTVTIVTNENDLASSLQSSCPEAKFSIQIE